jgi:hypothetical protein
MMCLLLAIYLCLNFEVQSCSSYEQWTVLRSVIWSEEMGDVAVNSELIWEESFGLKKWVMACNNLVSEFDHQNDMPSYWWYTGYYMLSFWFMWLCNLLRNCYLCKAQQKQATHSWYTLEALLPKQHFPTVRESSSILVHSKLQVIVVYICKTIRYSRTGPRCGLEKNMSCNLQVF